MQELYLNNLLEHNFSGRTSRKEFWSFFAVHTIIYCLIFAIAAAFKGWGLRIAFAFFVVYTVVSIWSLVAITVRRLHDVGMKGALVLLGLVPIVGWTILLLFCAKDSEDGVNKYGIDARIEQDEFV